MIDQDVERICNLVSARIRNTDTGRDRSAIAERETKFRGAVGAIGISDTYFSGMRGCHDNDAGFSGCRTPEYQIFDADFDPLQSFAKLA